MGTLHAFCARVLRDMASVVGYAPDFAIYDEVDRLAVLQDAARDLGADARSQAQTLLKHDGVRSLYEDRMREACAVTYDQLESLALEALDEAGVPEGLRFEHILVDEAQDLNATQTRLIKLLNADNVFLVGDPRQAIYGFRGARPDIFEAYLGHEAVERIDLTANYRSGADIVGVSNAVMDGWPALQSAAEAQADVDVVVADDEQKAIADSVRKLVEDHELAEGDIAVLGRTWSCVRFAAAALREAGIPFRYYGSANDPWEQPGGRMLARWLLLQGRSFDDNLTALVARQLHPDLPLGQCRADARQQRRSLSEHLIGESRMPLPVDTDDSRVAAHGLTEWSMATQVREEFDVALETLERPRVRTLKGFRYWWYFGRQTADQVDHGGDRVHLMTIHAAKGLEFPAVIMPWASHGTYPFFSEESWREACRVFYVGLTRAQHHLIFTRQRVLRGRTTSPSPFLKRWQAVAV
jgi:DNA helicase-2/ATP-dependent DNA helicase PcrA